MTFITCKLVSHAGKLTI